MQKRNKSSNSQPLIIFQTLSLLLGLIIVSPVVNAQKSNFEIKQDFEYYGIDMRSEYSYYPDKEQHIRGLDYIKINIDNDYIILNINDSLFVDNTSSYLSVIVEDSVNSDMPIATVRLGAYQTYLSIPKLIGDKNYVRVIIWINSINDNDAKRVLQIRRTSSNAITH
jgi:hypothetical protein